MKKKLINLFVILLVSNINICNAVPAKNTLNKVIYLSLISNARNLNEPPFYTTPKEIKPQEIEMISEKYESCGSDGRSWDFIMVISDLDLISEGFKALADKDVFSAWINENRNNVAMIPLPRSDDEFLIKFFREGTYQIEQHADMLKSQMYVPAKEDYSTATFYNDLKEISEILAFNSMDQKESDQIESERKVSHDSKPTEPGDDNSKAGVAGDLAGLDNPKAEGIAKQDGTANSNSVELGDNNLNSLHLYGLENASGVAGQDKPLIIISQNEYEFGDQPPLITIDQDEYESSKDNPKPNEADLKPLIKDDFF